MQLRPRVWIFLLAIVFSSATLKAQSGGTILGVVQDEMGAVIPGAKMTITNVDTGIARTTVSDSGGRYEVTALIPGHYEVQAVVAGFQTEVRKGVTLTVGSELPITLVMKVGQVTQTAEVTAEAPIVETTTDVMGGLVDTQTVRDLPLNGRSFDYLVDLESSAPMYRMNTYNLATGMEQNFSVNGAWLSMNQYLMDGTQLVGAGTVNTAPGGVVGMNLGVEAIQEFQVLTGGYDAEYGKRMGGVVNVATRSGTNQFHGSLYEFLRNNDLDARNFFDPLPSVPPFKRNQFGAAVGGPIRKDKTFFFANYEGLRASASLTNIALVPDNNARQGFLPCTAAATFACNSSTGLANVGVAPSVQPYLAIFPVANGPVVGGGVAQYVDNPNEPTTMNYYLARIDHQISATDSLFGRYNTERSTQNVPQTNGFLTLDNTSHDQFLTLEERHLFSPTTLNTLRFGFSRGNSPEGSSQQNGQPFNPALGFVPGAPAVGIISFAAIGTSSGPAAPLTAAGTSIEFRRLNVINQYEGNDQVFHQYGPHSLKFGVEVQKIQHMSATASDRYGAFAFPSLAGFLEGTPSSFVAPNPAVGADAEKGYRLTFAAAYIQDDYKVSRNLTLNLGLRYELMTVPVEVNGFISNFRPVQTASGYLELETTPTLGSPFWKGNDDLFAPRFGLAWDVFGNGRTAVRGGYGIYYDQLETFYLEDTGSNPPWYDAVTIKNPPFPFGFSNGVTAGLASADGVSQNMRVPTRQQYNLSIQQRITPNSAITIGYVGAHSTHLTRVADANQAVPEVLPAGSVGCTITPCLYFPPGSPSINPGLAPSELVMSNGNEIYQALQMDYTQRLSHGLRTKVSFTWAKNIDDVANVDTQEAAGAVYSPLIEGNIKDDRGLSPYGNGRNLVANFTYDLPFNHFRGAPQKLVSGWQLGAIATVSDGNPFTAYVGFDQAQADEKNVADRPNLLPGMSQNPIIGSPHEYYNPQAFGLPLPGFFGDLGRDTLIGPGFGNVDLTLEKSTAVNERMRVLFRFEVFNLLNRANFSLPNNTIFNSNGTYNAAAGLITATSTTSRQLQFGIKLLF